MHDRGGSVYSCMIKGIFCVYVVHIIICRYAADAGG